jgi:parvulin-like peptidyl-prolyl isomerase
MFKQSGWFFGIIFILGLILSAPVGAAEPLGGMDLTEDMNIPGVVAKVNGTELRSDYIRFRLNLDIRRIGQNLNVQQKAKLAGAIIEKEIVRELMYQEGQTKGKGVSPETIEKELQAFKKSYGSEEKFQESLKARGINEDELKKGIEVDLIAKNLLDERVKGKVHISDTQVKKFYEDKKESFKRPDSFRARHIFVAYVPFDVVKNTPPDEMKEKAGEYRAASKKKIDEVFAKVKSGGNFEELAKQYSEDKGSADKGGDLDFMYKGVFDPQFDKAVAGLKVGETSDIVETEFGYHIIRLMETKPADYAPFADVEESIQKHLFMTEAQKLVGRYIEVLRKKADIIVYYRGQ